MAFKINAIKNKGGAGAGLLNERSKELENKNLFKIHNIPFEQIQKNSENGWHIDDDEIQELMQSIRTFGLKQNLDVLPLSDTEFRLVSGEKRYTALEGLRKNKEWGDTVPCTFTELDDIDLPLDDDEKEFFSMRETNYHQRKYTDSDWLFEIERMEKIYDKLRAAGYEEYKGTQIKGRKTRDIIAQKAGLKPTKTGWMQKVNHKGTDELKQAIKDEEIKINVASEVAGMEPDDQIELLKEVKESGKEKIEANDVKTFQQKKKKNADTIIDENVKHTYTLDGISYQDEVGEYTITENEFEGDIKDIFLKEESFTLNSKQYIKYKDLISKLKKLLS